MFLEQRLGEGRYRIGERLGRHRGGLVHQIEVPTLGKASALAAQEHGGPGFTNGVEDLEDHRLQRIGLGPHQADVAQGLADEGARCTGEQGAIQIEERRTRCRIMVRGIVI